MTLAVGTALALSLVAAPALAALPDAAGLLAAVDKAEGYKTAYMEMAQTITTSSGTKRTMRIAGWSVNNGDKQLSVYLGPARVKGVKMLVLGGGDDIWFYSPSSRRTRKIASHARKKKVMGSDFSYEDSAGGSYSRKYKGRTLRADKADGVDCWVVELKPTAQGPSYDKVVSWLGKADHIVRRADFYRDGGSKPFKRLTMANVRTFGGKKIATKMVMASLEGGSNTLNVINKVDFAAKIPAGTFNPRRLERR